MIRSMRNKHGFTLMELLVVIAILGILITVGLSSFMSSQKKSRDLKRKNDMRQIGLALEAYYNDKNRYPASSVGGKIMGCYVNQAEDEECSWGGEFKDINNTVYMVALPSDASDGMQYMYTAALDGSSYQLYGRLENTLDSEIPKDSEQKARVFSDINCSVSGTAYCNYGVSSSNKTVEEGRTVMYE